jgi:hypothetical protein
MKLLAGIIGGLIIGVLGAIVIALGGATGSGKSGVYGAAAFFVLWAVGVVIALRSPSASKAWRRLLITAAVLSFLLPLSGIVFTGSHVATTYERGGQYSGAAAAGAAIGGGLVSGFMGVVGFFLGAIFLTVGLLVGRDKQVVYINGSRARKERDPMRRGAASGLQQGPMDLVVRGSAVDPAPASHAARSHNYESRCLGQPR